MRHKFVAVVLVVVLSLMVSTAALAASTPTEAWRALQKAAEARDAAAMAALLTPEERDALQAQVADDGVAIAARRIPKGALKITSESADLVAGEVDGRSILFVRDGANWLVGAIFAKARKPVAKLDVVDSVRAEQGHVVGVQPIRGAGLPTGHAISGARAYEVLLAEARDVRPGARLYSLDTGMHGLSAEGTSSGWVAEFSTETPGELLSILYDDGDVEHLPTSSYDLDRPGLPEPDGVGYDVKKLYEETVRYAGGVVEPITLVTASLYRSFGSGKALWLLNVYGDDDRIGQTVVFDAKTMKFSHKTK
jgi:hypothetical protein